MIRRLLITSLLLLAGAGYLAHATRAETVPPRRPLATLPVTMAPWEGREGPPFAANVLAVLGVDEYVNRVYVSSGSRTPYVGLYVGYYESQRQGDTMHSPLNCLPGAGWQSIRQGRTALTVTDTAGASRPITVNQFVIQKGLDRLMVLYWYQSHGRVIASEYTSKIYMVYDAMRLNRTDGALVRVITPITGTSTADEDAAAQRAAAFVQGLFPSLSGVLPS
jgi:EpsI family protein